MRHMGWLFDALDVEQDQDSRRQLDSAIRETLGLPEGAHCPEVWAAIKERRDELDALVPEIAVAMGQ